MLRSGFPVPSSGGTLGLCSLFKAIHAGTSRTCSEVLNFQLHSQISNSLSYLATYIEWYSIVLAIALLYGRIQRFAMLQMVICIICILMKQILALHFTHSVFCVSCTHKNKFM